MSSRIISMTQIKILTLTSSMWMNFFFTKNQPFPSHSTAFNYKDRPKFFEAPTEEHLDDGKWYKDQLHSFIKRIMKESESTNNSLQ